MSHKKHGKRLRSFTNEAGVSLVALIISIGIFAIIAMFGTKFAFNQSKNAQASLARENSTKLVKLLNQQFNKRVATHRTEEGSSAPQICGSIDKYFLNMLRRTGDQCGSTDTYTEPLDFDPFAAEADAIAVAEVAKRGGKFVAEELVDDSGTFKVRRYEYETVCVSTIGVTPLQKVDFSNFGAYKDVIEAHRRSAPSLRAQGCVDSSMCPLGAGNMPAILERTHFDWDDSDDNNGAFNWTAAVSSNQAMVQCYPKSVMEPTNDNSGCRYRSQPFNFSAHPFGAAMCAWTDDLTTPTIISARFWAIDASATGSAVAVRENVNVFNQADLSSFSGTSGPPSTTNFTCSGGQTVGGYCWYLSNYGDDCDSVCSANSGVYDEATRTYAGSDGNLSNCYSVMTAIATPLGSAMSANLSNPCGANCAVGCVTNPSNFVWRYHGGAPTNSTADWPSAPGPFNRACACRSP